MTDANRRYSQTITLTVNFDEEHQKEDVFRTLFRNKVGVARAHETFSLSHINHAGTKEVYRITSAFQPGHIDQDNLFQADKNLLNFVLGKDNWDYVKVSVPTEPRPFNPTRWGIHQDLLTNAPFDSEMTNWYSHSKESHVSDVKLVHPLLGTCNPHRFNFKYHGDEMDGIHMLEFKMHISADNNDVLKGTEAETDYILQKIVNACSKVGDMTHSFGCVGEIEVEKTVSCGRFAHEEEE